MNLKRLKRKYFKSTEEVVSMFLGLVIVVVVVGLIFNFFQKKKGSITIPGSTDVEISQNIKENIGLDEYVVKKGDSLWKIAEMKYNDGYKWSQIAKENNLKNPGSIEIGQKLVLPKIETKEVITNVDVVKENGNVTLVNNEYKVVRNDSLWKIAVKVYGDGYQWVKIWQTNKSKINNPDGLEIGMTLTIPNLK